MAGNHTLWLEEGRHPNTLNQYLPPPTPFPLPPSWGCNLQKKKSLMLNTTAPSGFQEEILCSAQPRPREGTRRPPAWKQPTNCPGNAGGSAGASIGEPPEQSFLGGPLLRCGVHSLSAPAPHLPWARPTRMSPYRFCGPDRSNSWAGPVNPPNNYCVCFGRTPKVKP